MEEPAKTTAVDDARKPGCPRCGIGTPIFKDSCIVCCSMPDAHAALLHEVLNHKLRAEAQLCQEREARAALKTELKRVEGFLDAERNNHRVSITQWAKDETAVSQLQATVGQLREAINVIKLRVEVPGEFQSFIWNVANAALATCPAPEERI
jgi:hypothetical protein